MKREYAVRELRIDDKVEVIEGMLNGMSREGWELMRLDSGFFFFRRPVVPCRCHVAAPEIGLR